MDSNNTKCNKILCDPLNWKNSIDELLEIVASGRTTVLLPEKKAIENIEKLIQEKDYIKITDEIKDSLKFGKLAQVLVLTRRSLLIALINSRQFLMWIRLWSS